MIVTTETKPKEGSMKSPFQYFDVLEKQEGDSSVEHKIPIRKIRFEDIPKPTDINPEEILGKKEEKKEIKFVVPQKILDFLDRLIVKDGRPLKGLKFDVKECLNKEDLEKCLNNSRVITMDERDSLLEILKQDSFTITNTKDRNNLTENESKDISHLRSEYISELVPYENKIKEDRAKYMKIMAQLGVQKDMPAKEEPKDLVEKRAKYFEIRKKGGSLSDGNIFPINETENFREEVIKNSSVKIQKINSFGEKIWLQSKDSHIVADALAGSLDSLNQKNPIPEEVFYGMRGGEKAPIGMVKTPAPEIKKEIKDMPKIGEVVLKPISTQYLEKSKTEFMGKIVDVTYDKISKVIRVSYDQKEIAVGQMTTKGPEIKINPKFKASFLLAPTLEQKAFNSVLPYIKTLKP